MCEDWRILGWCEDEVSDDLLRHLASLNKDLVVFEEVKQNDIRLNIKSEVYGKICQITSTIEGRWTTLLFSYQVYH